MFLQSLSPLALLIPKKTLKKKENDDFSLRVLCPFKESENLRPKAASVLRQTEDHQGLLHTQARKFHTRDHLDESVHPGRGQQPLTIRQCLRPSSFISSPPTSNFSWVSQVQSLGQEDPLERDMATHSSILAWKNPMDRGAWRATVCGVSKSPTRSDLARQPPRRLQNPQSQPP